MSDFTNEPHDDLHDSDSTEFDQSAFDALKQDLAPMMEAYREDVLDRVAPSAAYRASMHKMMLGLVRDDVLQTHKKSAVSTRLAGRWQRLLACWKELVATSFLFRLGTQGAFALGLGLILSMGWMAAMDETPLAARMSSEDQRELVPEAVWRPRMPSEDVLPPAPLGDLREKRGDETIPRGR